MLHCGWELQDLDRNAYFSKDGEKEFTIYTPGTGLFHRSYLQVLLQAEWLFEAGISSIFHCQSKAYYDCILSLAKMGATEDLKNLQPQRPAAEYKQMVKTLQEPGNKVKRNKGTGPNKPDADLMAEEEEEPNLLCAPGPACDPQQSADQKAILKSRRRKKQSSSAAAAPSSAAILVSCSDSEASDGQDGQNGPVAVAGGSGNLLKAMNKAARFSAQAKAGKEKIKQRKVLEKKGDEEHDASHFKRRRVKKETDKSDKSMLAPPAVPAQEVAEMDIVISSEDETAEEGIHMEHTAAADSAAQADVSISSQNVEVDISKTNLPGCDHDPMPSSAANSPAEVSAAPAPDPATFSSSTAAVPAAPAPAPATSSSSTAAVPAAPAPAPATSSSSKAAGSTMPTRSSDAAVESSSMFNLSTVWLGNIAIVKRSDKGSEPRIALGVCQG